MKTFLNYLGQFRLYSLVDLIILLLATQARPQDFFGTIFLHLGFLVFLETQHSHSFRKKMPKWLWVFLIILGISLYWHWEVIPFLILSYFYTKKTEKYFGCIAPVLRGFQYFFLIAGIVGYNNPLIWIALVVIFIRNFAGDLRDIEKDKKENLKTLPIVLGLNKDIKYIHLIVMMATTLIWFLYTSMSSWLIFPILIFQILTYGLTAR